MKKSAPPIILHAHVPKTAGQSLGSLIRASFGTRHFSLYNDRPDDFLSVDDLHKIVIDNRELMTISSHSIRNFPTMIAGRPVLYVTFLRDPTAMFISLLKYLRRAFCEQNEQTRMWWPPNTSELSLRDLAAHHLKQRGQFSQVCFQTRFFCHPSNIPDTMGYGTFVTAATTLDSFFFVGVVELFTQSVSLLRQKLLTFGISLAIDNVPSENESKISSSELSWLNEEDEVGREVLRCNYNDYRLYQRYRNKLVRELELGGLLSGNGGVDSQTSIGGYSRVEPLNITRGQVSRAVSEFSSWEYRRINARRLEHLASLGLPLTNRTVWEVSAGIGDLTSFFLDRDCDLCITDVRPVLLEILRDRFSSVEIASLDLEDPVRAFTGLFEVVFCYGTLYHVRNPHDAIAFLASRCKDLLILETCISRGSNLAVNPVKEDRRLYSQAFHGTGCRPTRRFVFEELKSHFAFVYVSVEQPHHEQFPYDWTCDFDVAPYERSIFVASRVPLQSRKLIADIPKSQKVSS